MKTTLFDKIQWASFVKSTCTDFILSLIFQELQDLEYINFQNVCRWSGPHCRENVPTFYFLLVVFDWLSTCFWHIFAKYLSSLLFLFDNIWWCNEICLRSFLGGPGVEVLCKPPCPQFMSPRWCLLFSPTLLISSHGFSINVKILYGQKCTWLKNKEKNISSLCSLYESDVEFHKRK